MARNLNPNFQDKIIDRNLKIARNSGSVKDPSLMSLKEQIEQAERQQAEEDRRARQQRFKVAERRDNEVRFTHY